MAGPTKNIDRPIIVLALEPTAGTNLELIQGASEFGRDQERWEFRLDRVDLAGRLQWQGQVADGVIFPAWNDRICAGLSELDACLVGVLREAPLAGVPVVTDSDEGICREAVAHFATQGYEAIGYVDSMGGESETARRRVFERMASEAGLSVHLCPRSGEGGASGGIREIVTSWLASVPKPIGVLGHDNHTGRILVDCCIDAGIDVPDQVAILGCGAEDVHIWMSQPELSYVDTGARRIGYAAAEAMHRQLAGEPSEAFTQFAPLGVVRRGSTRGVLVEHDPVAAGVRFIRDHITEKLSVQRVAEASGMSLRGLGYAFQRELGRSVHQEVLRQRVDLAKQLLATTDLPLARICQRVGFGHASKLCSLIKRYTGRTPTQYRQAKRADVAAVGAGPNGKESK